MIKINKLDNNFYHQVLEVLKNDWDITNESIGEGSNGKIFKIKNENKVLKISTNVNEYLITKQLVGKNFNYIYNVHDCGLIYGKDDEPIGCYSVNEYLKTTKEDKYFKDNVNKFIKYIEDFFDSNKKYVKEDDYYRYQELSILLDENLSYDLYKLLLLDNESLILGEIYYQIVGAIKEIKLINNVFVDFHIDNIGYDKENNRIKLFDFNYLE